jgi:hypothetical protein
MPKVAAVRVRARRLVPRAQGMQPARVQMRKLEERAPLQVMQSARVQRRKLEERAPLQAMRLVPRA